MIRKLPARIFMCGFMGTGKTAVGEALAKKMDQPFYDLDSYIEEEAGESIASIFKNEGEQGFRQKEKAALLDIIQWKTGVMALGGGALHNQHLTNHVKMNGLLVYLKTPMDIMLDRITKNPHRPLLMDKNGNMKSRAELRQELNVLYEQRLPFYEQAEITVESSAGHDVQTIAARLFKKIKYHVALH